MSQNAQCAAIQRLAGFSRDKNSALVSASCLPVLKRLMFYMSGWLSKKTLRGENSRAPILGSCSLVNQDKSFWLVRVIVFLRPGNCTHNNLQCTNLKKNKAHIEFQLKCSYTPMCTMIFVDVMAKNSFVITQNSLNRNVRGVTFCDIFKPSAAIFKCHYSGKLAWFVFLIWLNTFVFA